MVQQRHPEAAPRRSACGGFKSCRNFFIARTNTLTLEWKTAVDEFKKEIKELSGSKVTLLQQKVRSSNVKYANVVASKRGPWHTVREAPKGKRTKLP